MISNARIAPTLPVQDLERAKRFYHQTLGLDIYMEGAGKILFRASTNAESWHQVRIPR